MLYYFFFFNDTAPTEIYTLSLHDALPISHRGPGGRARRGRARGPCAGAVRPRRPQDRAPAPRRAAAGAARRSEEHTSDSSHSQISYAVFCLKKKKKKQK